MITTKLTASKTRCKKLHNEINKHKQRESHMKNELEKEKETF